MGDFIAGSILERCNIRLCGVYNSLGKSLVIVFVLSAFQKGKVIEPIHVVDVYQVLTHVLGLTPQPHNGTWSHVQDAFVQSMPASHDGHDHMNDGAHDHDHAQMGAHDHDDMGAHNHDGMSDHDHDDHDHDHDGHDHDHMSNDDDMNSHPDVYKHDTSQQQSANAAPSLQMASLSGILAALVLHFRF